MSYVTPQEIATKMIEAGEYKAFMSTKDTLIRAYMAGAILALAAAFAITIAVDTGSFLLGSLLFPVGFCMLYLLGYDLLTGVFTLVPLALFARRPGVTCSKLLRNWTLVFFGNLAGALTTASLMAVVFTMGFSEEPNAVGQKIGRIGEMRTLGYADADYAGMMTLFVRAVMCNWMVSTGVVAAMMSTTVSGKVIGMWMPILIFFYLGFEHSIVNMYLFPSGIMLGGSYTWVDYLLWNEIPTLIGNLVGGLTFVGVMIYATHYKPSQFQNLVVEPAANPRPQPDRSFHRRFETSPR